MRRFREWWTSEKGWSSRSYRLFVIAISIIGFVGWFFCLWSLVHIEEEEIFGIEKKAVVGIILLVSILLLARLSFKRGR